MFIRTITVMSLCTLITACGSTPEERGVSGAGIGAGAGAVIGAVTGLSVLEAAAMGAAGGALTGVLTDKEDLDLGEPVWKSGKNDNAGNRSTVAEIQKGLQELGYNPGPVDGIPGKQTQDAIRQYQQDNNLLVDGMATRALLDHIKAQKS